MGLLTPKCTECGRVFDLLDETDAQEWAYGHDCEPQKKSETGDCSECSDNLGCPPKGGPWCDHPCGGWMAKEIDRVTDARMGK
ncbi:MAG: hypothetical protein JW753_11210 [Dehalococcoidia bacterium]|nr:hypothetical protein [Dehalococcoidia bacterium]